MSQTKATHSLFGKGILTTEHSESSHGLPVFVQGKNVFTVLANGGTVTVRGNDPDNLSGKWNEQIPLFCEIVRNKPGPKPKPIEQKRKQFLVAQRVDTAEQQAALKQIIAIWVKDNLQDH